MVMELKITLPEIKFNRTGYSKNVRQIIEARFREAVRAFVRVAAPKVPVETGMARGSMLELARAVNKRANLKINPTRTNQTYYHSDGTRHPKTKETGAQFAPFLLGWQTPTEYVFNYANEILHYFQDERKGASPASPWGSWKAGMAAFRAEMQKLGTQKRFPQVKDHISVTYRRIS